MTAGDGTVGDPLATILTAASAGSLPAALDRAAGLRPLLVATDFDGVLAPFVEDPMSAKPTPGTMQAIRALATLSGVHVAVVSGRDLHTLRLLTGLGLDEPVTLIGSHGAESTSRAVRAAMDDASLTEAAQARLAQLTADVEQLVTERHPEARVERKTAGVAVHTRGLPADLAKPAIADALALGLAATGVRVLEGKSVLELSVSHADKGAALAALARSVEARGRVYLGDDVTDEDVFATMTEADDVSIKVGPGNTAARYRVDNPAAAAAVLDLVRRLALDGRS